MHARSGKAKDSSSSKRTGQVANSRNAPVGLPRLLGGVADTTTLELEALPVPQRQVVARVA